MKIGCLLERREERAGELFIYVNDALVPLPLIGELFYWNNGGKADILIKRLR
jgi:hypothetical protein